VGKIGDMSVYDFVLSPMGEAPVLTASNFLVNHLGSMVQLLGSARRRGRKSKKGKRNLVVLAHERHMPKWVWFLVS